MGDGGDGDNAERLKSKGLRMFCMVLYVFYW